MPARKQRVVSTTAVWPYTPEPSPPLSPIHLHIPVEDHNIMPDEQGRLRPVSIISRREGALSPSGRPTLDDVLNNRAPSPYTLAAYTAFLSQQHCLETLEFVTEAKKYSYKYDQLAAHMAGMPLTVDSDEVFELVQDWCRLLDIYVKPGAPREINLPAEERDHLIVVQFEPKPPPPEALDPAVKRMYDLMSDSIFIPFCNSMKAIPPTGFMASSPGLPPTDMVDHYPSSNRERSTKRRASPPTTSPHQQRMIQPINVSSGLGRTSSARLSPHMSHSSAASDAAMSDQSSVYRPTATDREMTSPPLTPPSSDLPSYTRAPLSHSTHPKTGRTETGGWKKNFNKFFGNKKK